MVEVGGACVCGRIPAAEGCSAAVLRAGLTWLQSPHRGFCCPWSIAAKHIQSSRLKESLQRDAAVYPPTSASEIYLVGFGTVFERAWIVDIIHQAHHVTGEVGLWQEVEIRHHLMELVYRERGREGRWRDHQIVTLLLYCVETVGPYQEVLLLAINISRVDGIQRLVVFSNSPLLLAWMKNRY